MKAFENFGMALLWFAGWGLIAFNFPWVLAAAKELQKPTQGRHNDNSIFALLFLSSLCLAFGAFFVRLGWPQ